MSIKNQERVLGAIVLLMFLSPIACVAGCIADLVWGPR